MTQTLARLFGLAFLFLALFAQAQQPIPPLAARVTDQTGTLPAADLARLEAKLAAFETAKGSQVAVLIVATTEPEDIAQYGIRVAEAWKVGRKDIADGVILIVAKNDRRLRIEVGRGLEGAIPDAAAKRIVAETIAPHFKAGNFAGGIEAGVDRIIRTIEGEPLPEPARRAEWSHAAGTDWGTLLPLAFMFVLVFGGILKALLGRILGSAVNGGLMGYVAYTITGLMLGAVAAGVLGFIFSLTVGAFGRGAWASHGRGGHIGGLPGGWSSGGGGWSSGGGGGWSGGGGDFGGGGASGDW